MSTVTLELRGDQIGTYTSFSGSGNNADRVVTVNGVEAIGSASEIFTIVVEQVNGGVTEFQNGQFVTIFDSNGDVVMPRTVAQPDVEQGFGAGDEHMLFSGQRFLIDLGGVPDGPSTVTYGIDDEVAGPEGDDDGNLDFTDFPCFAAGTMIDTPGGAVDVADLRIGDRVLTRDHGAQPVLWAGRRVLDLSADVGPARPVVLAAGSMGRGMPLADTVMSPDHRVLLREPICEVLYGEAEVLAPAKGLMGLPGVGEMDVQSVDYITLLTPRHEVIFANGLPVETLYPGPEALHRLGAFGRAAVLAALPRLRHEDVRQAYPALCRMLNLHEARAYVAGHSGARTLRSA
ncbi:Hint domain-containing protein [Alphaproteobacteria bacterium KMM 3653]|uniref:Hint domain-containing protein n=1 Tax=Harenicola maris TaxID=2841044 RepID=A0AAP2CR34_9RHOB|nr:Hint domain-containing protein [Harenicola maris]